MNKPIYLDYNATTPLDPRVFEAMKPYLQEEFGNASSASHPYGWAAKSAVDKARKQVASIIGAKPQEIFFTSGATESNNMALMGAVRDFVFSIDRSSRPHIITSNIEHKAVLDVVGFLAEAGCEATVVEADHEGRVHPEKVEQALRPNTRLVSVMLANNEIGTINPIAEIGSMVRNKNILFHTDAAQGVGKLPIHVDEMNIDLLSISGHKIYGPKGVGALYVRKQGRPVDLKPITFGGAQEEGLRPGTLNVAGIIGLGKACEICEEQIEVCSKKLTVMRDRVIDEVLANVPGAKLNGPRKARLPNNVSFSFEGLCSDVFALGLSGLALSSSSACASANGGGSYVLRAIGRCQAMSKATIRIGLGRDTSDKDIDTAISKIIDMAEKNTAISAS